MCVESRKMDWITKEEMRKREREKGERNGGKTKINLSIVMKKEKGNFVEKCDGCGQ